MMYSTPLAFTPKPYYGFDLPYDSIDYIAYDYWTYPRYNNGKTMDFVQLLLWHKPSDTYTWWIRTVDENGNMLPWIQMMLTSELIQLDSTVNGMWWIKDDICIFGASEPITSNTIYILTRDFITFTHLTSFDDIFAPSFTLLPNGDILAQGDKNSGGIGTPKYYWINSDVDADPDSWTEYTVAGYYNSWGSSATFNGKVYMVVYESLGITNAKVISCTDATNNSWAVETSITGATGYSIGLYAYDDILWVYGGRGSENLAKYKNKIDEVWTPITPLSDYDTTIDLTLWIGIFYNAGQTLSTYYKTTDNYYRFVFYNRDTDGWEYVQMAPGLKRQLSDQWSMKTIFDNKFLCTWWTDNDYSPSIGNILENPQPLPLI